ncbi:MAG: plasmid pRiA4b ORF-3 family protein [Peptostreptococcaceae bacterium]|nr:plasmid pRiA4b ORF-3 family protein [Peptostreptococcaceae bacterium]
MIINCTKKLQDEIGIKPMLMPVENPLFSWHTNILRINRRKTIVLVNDASRYTVILYGLKAKDLKNIKELIIYAIKQTLLDDGVSIKMINEYMKNAGDIIFSKTQSRSNVAKLNKSSEAAEIFYSYYIEESTIQTSVSKKINRSIFVEYGGEHKYPYECFYEQLEENFNLPTIRCKALELKVTMELENFDVWRKVMVPLNFTFEELHEVMQIIFDWKDYHLHDFIILDNNQPYIDIVESEEELVFEIDIPVILNKNIKIANYLPKYKKVNYRYDFGDGWQHIIKVENLSFDYNKNYAYCLDGEGNTPPENVGGEDGYAEFIKIMDDPTCEEYENTKLWAESQWYKSFDMDLVNRRLKNI